MSAPVFLDCEFTSLARPALLSVGLVALDGGALYLELDPQAPEGRARCARATAFVRQTVLPLFGRVPGAALPHEAALAERLSRWLVARPEGCVELAYDYHADYDLLEQALRLHDGGTQLARRLRPVHVGYLLGDSDARAAMNGAWRQARAQGLERHHALADAQALRAAFIAVHGQP